MPLRRASIASGACVHGKRSIANNPPDEANWNAIEGLLNFYKRRKDSSRNNVSASRLSRQEIKELRSPTDTNDPWLRMVSLLQVGSAPSADTLRVPTESDGCQRRSGLGPAAPCENHGSTVNIIDRPSSNTVTIAWRDATRGSYGDQLWRRIRARSHGVCAISGAFILRGESVFSPWPARPPSANAGAMILASLLDAIQLEPDTALAEPADRHRLASDQRKGGEMPGGID
ncbi:hypothetical protein GCM10027093_32820 [Paraburkholderia jirisanensis]